MKKTVSHASMKGYILWVEQIGVSYLLDIQNTVFSMELSKNICQFLAIEH